MPARIVTPPAAIDFDAIRAELAVPADYPADAVREALAVASDPPRDARRADIPFVTVDPVGSMDLDQAVHLARDGDGYLVRYAIADVAAFVAPDGATGRGVLAPRRDAVQPRPATPPCTRSSCPRARPACCRNANGRRWCGRCDWTSTASRSTSHVRRTMVMSVAQLAYPAVQADADAGTLHPSIELLPEIGQLRQQRSQERHAISLDIPDAEIVRGPRRPLDPGTARRPGRGAVQRRDQPADRDVRGDDHAARSDRAAAHAAVADPRSGPRTAQSHCRAGHPVARLDVRPGTSSPG